MMADRETNGKSEKFMSFRLWLKRKRNPEVLTQTFDGAHNLLMVLQESSCQLFGGQLAATSSGQAVQHFLWQVLHSASEITYNVPTVPCQYLLITINDTVL